MFFIYTINKYSFFVTDILCLDSKDQAFAEGVKKIHLLEDDFHESVADDFESYKTTIEFLMKIGLYVDRDLRVRDFYTLQQNVSKLHSFEYCVICDAGELKAIRESCPKTLALVLHNRTLCSTQMVASAHDLERLFSIENTPLEHTPPNRPYLERFQTAANNVYQKSNFNEYLLIVKKDIPLKLK